MNVNWLATACFVVFLQFGLLPAAFVIFLAYRFHGLIKEIRSRTYASSWYYLTNIQDPLYRFHKIQGFTMEKIKEHFKNCKNIEENMSIGSTDEIPKIKKHQTQIQNIINERSNVDRRDGLDRRDVLTLDEIDEIENARGRRTRAARGGRNSRQ